MKVDRFALLLILSVAVGNARYTYNCSMNSGSNLFQAGTPNVYELEKLCDSIGECVGFDTLGNLKSSVSSQSFDDGASLYVKIPGPPLTPLPKIWPLPTKYSSGQTTVTLANPFTFQSSSSSKILSRAFDRYTEMTFPNAGVASKGLAALKVVLETNNETLQLYTPEDYSLTISASSAVLTATTVFGAIRGLETFSQLVEFDYDSQTYKIHQTPWSIEDEPYFAHRGILVDTSRHWLPLRTLRSIIDSLSFAKFNVLHWHVVDGQSFPLESKAYPKLWEGSWTKKERYTLADVAELVLYAKDRGIRVMPEFDGPGHMWSWGVGYPELLPTGYTENPKCDSTCPINPCDVPIDPSNPKIYQLLEGLIKDLSDNGQPNSGIFFENLLHLGGDEVEQACWMQSPEIAQFMQQQGFTDYDQVYEYFIKRVHEIALENNRIPVHWEEVFLHFGKNLSADTIIHVWLDHPTLALVVQAGYRGILSNQNVWYLDHLETPWADAYTNDPLEAINENSAHLVLGGEACMWGESMDPSDVFARIWPKAAAVSEVLWNYQVTKGANAVDLAIDRLQNYRCHIMKRGIDTAPINSHYPTQPGSCYFS